MDASYRYKMPKLGTKVEGRGNGIKTVVVNMVDIAKALHVNPGYPTKFFGIELGAQSKFNKKTERAIVNGQHEAQDLAKLLTKFIDSFVLCPRCRLPEIKLAIKSNIKYDCAACGDNGVLPTNHRLSGYIVKSKQKDKEKGKDKKKGKRDKKKGKEEEEDEDDGEAFEEEEEEAGRDGEEKVQEKRDEDFEWFTDTSKDAQKTRKEKEFLEMQSAGSENLSAVDAILDAAKSDNKTESPATVLKIFMASAKRTIPEIMSELKRLQIARGLDEPQKIKVLLEAVTDVDDEKSVVKQYIANKKILGAVTKLPNGGNILLNCVEEQVGAIEPGLLKKTPQILQALYESDVLDEDLILVWAESPPESSWLVNKEVATAVRKKARPFIEWLKNADEESD